MSEERSAAAVWRDGVMRSLTAAWHFNPDQPRDPGGAGGGQWIAGPQTSEEEGKAGADEEAKRLFAQMLNMDANQQAAFLKTLTPDQLGRLGKFANLGSGDPQINQIRDSIGKGLESRGMDPAKYGFKPKKGKAGAKKKGGSGKSGGGGSKGGGGKKSGGGSKGGGKSSGGSKSSGSKKSSSSGSKSSGSKSSGSKTTTPKAPKPTPPPPPAPELRQIGPGRRGPGGPGGSGPGVPTPGPPKTQARRKRRSVRASGDPELGSLAEWNAARHAARRGQERGSGG